MPNFASKIFIDGGDPAETAQAKSLLGYIDGQTTNPSLVAKNPDIARRLESGNKFSSQELLDQYQQIIHQIDAATPGGAISIEVYADQDTKAETIINQARDMTGWAKNSYVKLPIIPEALKAAETLAQEMQLNFTLCFSQEQAAAVHAVTKNSPYQHYISPFIGRLDDKGLRGVDLVGLLVRMFRQMSATQVQVLAASIRSLDHLMTCLEIEADAITMPFKVFKEWSGLKFKVYQTEVDVHLNPIDIKDINTNLDWRAYNLQHELTDAGLEKFAADWNGLLK